eukprot:UN06389
MAAGHGPFFLTIVLTHFVHQWLSIATLPISTPLQECFKSSREWPSIIMKHLVRLYNLYNRYFLWYIGLLIEFFLIRLYGIYGPHFARVQLREELSMVVLFSIIRNLHKIPLILYILCDNLIVNFRVKSDDNIR